MNRNATFNSTELTRSMFLERLRNALRIALLPLMLLVATGATAAPWEIRGAAPEILIETATVGPSLRYPGTTGIWVTYSPSLSVDCSPPRGCYAKTQRIHYVFNCAPRYAMPVERISADLGGTVIKRETRSEGDPYVVEGDVAALIILDTYCPLRDSRNRRDSR